MHTPLCVDTEQPGKSESAVEVTTNSAANNTPDCRRYRLFVRDKKTGLRFLIDSGADVSLIPATKNDRVKGDFKLYAANGTEIPTYGIKMLTVGMGLRRPMQWSFIISGTTRGIIGADFLNKYKLIIDINNRKLIDGVTNLAIRGEITSITNSSTISAMDKTAKYYDILAQYPQITKPTLLTVGVRHNVEHHIITEGRPVYSKARQLDSKKLAQAKQEFQYM